MDGATRTWQWVLLHVPKVAIQQVGLDGAGCVWLAGWFNGSTATFGPVTLAHNGSTNGSTGYLARLGSGPLATQPAGLQPAALQVWSNPGGANVGAGAKDGATFMCISCLPGCAEVQ